MARTVLCTAVAVSTMPPGCSRRWRSSSRPFASRSPRRPDAQHQQVVHRLVGPHHLVDGGRERWDGAARGAGEQVVPPAAEGTRTWAGAGAPDRAAGYRWGRRSDRGRPGPSGSAAVNPTPDGPGPRDDAGAGARPARSRARSPRPGRSLGHHRGRHHEARSVALGDEVGGVGLRCLRRSSPPTSRWPATADRRRRRWGGSADPARTPPGPTRPRRRRSGRARGGSRRTGCRR